MELFLRALISGALFLFRLGTYFYTELATPRHFTRVVAVPVGVLG